MEKWIILATCLNQKLCPITLPTLTVNYDYLEGRNVYEKINCGIKDCEQKVRKIVNCERKDCELRHCFVNCEIKLRIFLGFLDYYFTVFAYIQ